MTGQEVGVEMGLHHPLDSQPVGLGLLQVTGDVPLGVDHHRPARRLVPDQIAEQRQATKLVLTEEHPHLLVRYELG
jgi:hypothetical protein